MDKKKRYLEKSKKRNDISHLYGYENLEFGQIREKLLEHLESLTISTIGIREEKEQLPVISLSKDTSNHSFNFPTVKPVQRTESNPISLLEYQRKLELMENIKRYSSAIGSPTNLLSAPAKTVPRHSLQSQEEVQKHSPPSKEIYTDSKVIWIIIYMIHLILTKPRKKKPRSYEYDPFTGISNTELIEVFRSKKKVTTAKYIASASGILERVEYVPKKYVDKFRINEQLFLSGTLGKVTSFPVVNSEINSLLIDAREREKLEMDDVTQYSLRALQTLRIRKNDALAFIKTSYQQECNRLQSQNKLTAEVQARLLSKRIREEAYVDRVDKTKGNDCVKRDEFGKRLHTLFTLSPKRLRRFLYFAGVKDDLYILDLANAQPLLFVPTLMEHYQQNEWRDYNFEIDSVPTFLQLLRTRGKNEDVIRYIQLVQDGKLYSEIHRLMILSRFKTLKPLFSQCRKYLSSLVHDKDHLALIRTIHFWLPSLRKLLKIDQENPKTQQVLQKLFKIRKPNLDNPDLIDIAFVQELHEAITRAYRAK